MNAYSANQPDNKRKFRKPKINLSVVCGKLWASRKILLLACGVGAILGLIVALNTTKEYTARIYVAPEGYNRSSTSGLNALSALTGVQYKPSTDKDAIYPSLYPLVVKSTPFLTRLFDIKVRLHQDSTAITLASYLRKKKEKTDKEITPLQLMREQARLASAIASRIRIKVDKEKRTLTLLVTMPHPLVAATVADSVSAHLQEHITNYRTSKARRILKYNEQLCKDAKAAYLAAQKEYTRHADANQNLVSTVSRARLSTLRTEMDLAFAIYNQLELQVKSDKERVAKTTPVYAVIEPSTVPINPSKPRTALIIILWALLGLAGSAAWVLIKTALTSLSIKKTSKMEASQ